MSRIPLADTGTNYPFRRMEWMEPQIRAPSIGDADGPNAGRTSFPSSGARRLRFHSTSDDQIPRGFGVRYPEFSTDVGMAGEWMSSWQGRSIPSGDHRAEPNGPDMLSESDRSRRIPEPQFERQDSWQHGALPPSSYMTFHSLPSPPTRHTSPQHSSPENTAIHYPMHASCSQDGMQPPTEGSRSSIASRAATFQDTNTEQSDWQSEEDIIIRESFEEGSALWIFIADQLPGRSAQDVRRRWSKTSALSANPCPPKAKSSKRTGRNLQRRRSGGDELSPKLGRWDPEEDEKLLEAMRVHNRNWSACAKTIQGRDGKQCRARWMSLLVSNGRQQWANQ